MARFTFPAHRQLVDRGVWMLSWVRMPYIGLSFKQRIHGRADVQ